MKNRGGVIWWTFMIVVGCGATYLLAANPPGYQQQQQVAAPQYAAGLRPAPMALDETTLDLFRQMLSEQKRTNDLLQRLIDDSADPQPQGAVPKAAAPEAVPPRSAKPDGLQIFANFCVRCHGEKDAEAKGKGLILVSKDNRLLIDPDLAAKCLEKVESGEMPKSVTGVPPPSNDERFVLIRLFTQLKTKK